jgi:hypothetical protein
MDQPDSQRYPNPPAHFQSEANSGSDRYPRANGHTSPYGHSSSHRYPSTTATH